MTTCCEKEAIELRKVAKIKAVLRENDPVRKQMILIQQASGLNANLTGRLFVSEEEKQIQKRLQVALACCEDESYHGALFTTHSHGHCQDHQCTDHHCFDHGAAEADCSEYYPKNDVPTDVPGKTDVEPESDVEIDSDEELRLMGIGPNGEILDEEVEPERVYIASTSTGTVEKISVEKIREEQAKVFYRAHLVHAFTRNADERKATQDLKSVLEPTSSTTSVAYPIVCLVHKARSFNEFEPTPLEMVLDQVLTKCLVELMPASTKRLPAKLPFTYFRIAMQRCDVDTDLTQLLRGHSVEQLSASPAVIGIRGPGVPVDIISGKRNLAASFGRLLAAGPLDRIAIEEMASTVTLWLERSVGLTRHIVWQRMTAALSEHKSSTHHAVSSASAAELRARPSDAEEEQEQENPYCDRTGCHKQFAHRHIDAEHLSKECNHRSFMSNEFH